MNLDSQALSSAFPVHVGRVSVQFVGLESRSGTLRYALLRMVVDGELHAELRAAVRFTNRVVSPWSAAWGLSHSVRMSLAVIDLDASAAGVIGPPARPERAVDGVTNEIVARLRTRFPPTVRKLDWTGVAEQEHARLELSGLREIGDDLVASLTHTVGETQRTLRVIVLPFPDDQDEARAAAYRTALWAVLHLIVGLPASTQAEVPLDQLLQPSLLEESDLNEWREFAAAWVKTTALRAALDTLPSAGQHAPDAGGPIAEWMARGLVLTGLVGVADAVAGVGVPRMLVNVCFAVLGVAFLSAQRRDPVATDMARWTAQILWGVVALGVVVVPFAAGQWGPVVDGGCVVLLALGVWALHQR